MSSVIRNEHVRQFIYSQAFLPTDELIKIHVWTVICSAFYCVLEQRDGTRHAGAFFSLGVRNSIITGGARGPRRAWPPLDFLVFMKIHEITVTYDIIVFE